MRSTAASSSRSLKRILPPPSAETLAAEEAALRPMRRKAWIPAVAAVGMAAAVLEGFGQAVSEVLAARQELRHRLARPEQHRAGAGRAAVEHEFGGRQPLRIVRREVQMVEQQRVGRACRRPEPGASVVRAPGPCRHRLHGQPHDGDEVRLVRDEAADIWKKVTGFGDDELYAFFSLLFAAGSETLAAEQVYVLDDQPGPTECRSRT